MHEEGAHEVHPEGKDVGKAHPSTPMATLACPPSPSPPEVSHLLTSIAPRSSSSRHLCSVEVKENISDPDRNPCP